MTKPEKPGNAAKIAGVKVRKYFHIFIFHATPPDSRFIFILQIHEGFRKIGVGVKDDLAIVTLSKAVDE